MLENQHKFIHEGEFCLPTLKMSILGREAGQGLGQGSGVKQIFSRWTNVQGEVKQTFPRGGKFQGGI